MIGGNLEDEFDVGDGFTISEVEKTVQDIRKSLYLDLKGEDSYDFSSVGNSTRSRIAPSITARSDNMLAGASMPRFGRRVYIDEGCKQYVNLRRAGLLCGKLNFQNSDNGGGKDSPDRTRELLKALGPSSVIADCFLKWPEKLSKFSKLERRFSQLCGEVDDFSGLHYVRQSGLSGVCAQSVLFMAAAYWQDACESVL
ncbi:MAG: hypothetical protein AAF226_01675, partial [Verrucomicrobiota bacterium]